MNSSSNDKPGFKYEIEYSAKGWIIAGVDEVGRGSIAGPIVAGAVVFANYKKLTGLLEKIDDSKKLSDKQRRKLDELIKKKASAYSYGVVSVEEIDKLGIGAANVMAFERALDSISHCDMALIDGRKFKGFNYKYLCLEKGESKSLSIAAASIIAKVYRDDLMLGIAKEISHYDFSSNKGYGSKKHYDDLRSYGLSEHHRKSFLKFMFDTQTTLF